MAIMPYATYQQQEAYAQKQPGAGIRVALYRDDSPTPLIASTTGVNARDDFEAIPVEEAGEEGVDEVVVGRHTASGTIQIMWTPERNDLLPSRQSFLGTGNGHKYTILELTGDGRVGTDAATGEAVVLNAWTGCVISSWDHSVGARGVVSGTLQFLAERRYTGKEWADLNGL